MIKTKFIRITRQMTLLVSTILFCASDASGLNVDPFSFCTTSCKNPGLCATQESLKKECKRVCSPDHIWKQAAKLQMSSASGQQGQDFRKATPEAREKMMYNSPLAKCLELTAPAEKAAPLPPAPLPAAAAPVEKITSTKNDLCTAAVKKAMADFENDKIALEHGKTVLEAQKQDLATALKAHEATPKG